MSRSEQVPIVPWAEVSTAERMDVATMYELAQHKPDFNPFEEIKAVIEPPQYEGWPYIFGTYVDKSTREVRLSMTPSQLYAYGEPNVRLWPSASSDEDIAELLHDDCTSATFLRHFYYEAFSAGSHEQNMWRLTTALDVDNQAHVSETMRPNRERFDGFAMLGPFTSIVQRPAMYQLLQNLSQYMALYPARRDATLAVFRESSLTLASDERTKRAAKALSALLRRSSENDPELKDAFAEIGSGIDSIIEASPASLISVAANSPINAVRMAQYEALELALSGSQPQIKRKSMMTASFDIFMNILDSLPTAHAEAFYKLIKQTAQSKGSISIDTMIRVANTGLVMKQLEALQPEETEPLKLLSPRGLQDMPEAIDRILWVAMRDFDADDATIAAFESVRHSARLAAQIGVDRKLNERVITLGDLIIRYPRASRMTLQQISDQIQRGKREVTTHHTYRAAGVRRANRSKFGLTKPGSGAWS